MGEGSEDSRTTLVSTFSTWVGLTAKVAGKVDDFPPRREEMGALLICELTGDLEGLVGD